MTSPIPPRTSVHGASMHRLNAPTSRILMAAVILFTGAGISAVFWKMPASAESYELCNAGVVDKTLEAVPLPSESVAAISSEEVKQMALPALEVEPVADRGVEKYAQVYEAPASLAAPRPEVAVEHTAFKPVIPQKFEPMRQIAEEKAIAVESVNREFPSKPASVSTTEKSDELLLRFHFAENSRADFDSAASEQPADPFPVMSASAPSSSLQPLQPLPLEGLAPLLPLNEEELLPLAVLTAK